jgi:acid phosphatase type 7
MRSRYAVIGLVSAAHLLASALFGACGGSQPISPTAPTQAGTPASAGGPGATMLYPDEVFVGAGDIAQCGVGHPDATANLLDLIPGTVFTTGDNVQGSGTAGEYANCYDPTWGRHRWRTFPTVGNHDWDTKGGGPYFDYFGASAGPRGLGYYSYDLGAWHVVSLNSQVAAGQGSAQYEWLKADLAQSPASCTIALWHQPLFSSGPNGNSASMRDAWRLLQQSGAELVLNGHDHIYERFAPQDADGRATPAGMREFIVGTGGYSLYDRARVQPNSEVFENSTWGVLKLTLKAGGYDWAFIPIAGQSFRDSGTGTCSPAQPR